MIFKRIATVFLCFIVAVGPAACGTLLSDQQRAAMLADGEERYARGEISADELAALRALLAKDAQGRSWEDALWTIGGIAGSLFGVRIWRGGVTSRKGEAPSAPAPKKGG